MSFDTIIYLVSLCTSVRWTEGFVFLGSKPSISPAENYFTQRKEMKNYIEDYLVSLKMKAAFASCNTYIIEKAVIVFFGYLDLFLIFLEWSGKLF